MAQPHLGSAAVAPSGSDTPHCAHSGPRRTQGTRCHSDSKFCRRLGVRTDVQRARGQEAGTQHPDSPTQRAAPHSVFLAEGPTGRDSRSLGFFSSAVKMTAPPGRSGWGKG